MHTCRVRHPPTHECLHYYATNSAPISWYVKKIVEERIFSLVTIDRLEAIVRVCGGDVTFLELVRHAAATSQSLFSVQTPLIKVSKMGGDSVVALLSELPGDDLTVKLLEMLDFLVPGQWHNTTDIEAMIQREVGESHPGKKDRHLKSV